MPFTECRFEQYGQEHGDGYEGEGRGGCADVAEICGDANGYVGED